MPEFTIRVKGTATIPRLAERAALMLKASSTDNNKQAVSENVLTTARHIENAVREIQEKFGTPGSDDPATKPIAHYSKTSLSSTSFLKSEPVPLKEYQETFQRLQEHNKQREAVGLDAVLPEKVVRKRVYTAQLDFDIRFRDFAALGEFTARMSTVEHCEFHSIDWRLLPATRKAFESRLRKEAAADALQKAKDYCSVLCADGPLRIMPHELSISHSSSSFGGYGMPQMQQMQSMQQHIAPPARGGNELNFTPQECKMETNLEVVFHVVTEGVEVPGEELSSDSMIS